MDLSDVQVENIHHFLNHIVNDDDEWTTHIMETASLCNNDTATNVINTMLDVLDMQDPEDVELALEYVMAAIAFKYVKYTPLLTAAMQQMNISTFPGITKLRNAFRDGTKFSKLATPKIHDHAPPQQEGEVAQILASLQIIQKQQQSQAKALAKLQSPEDDSSSDQEEASEENDTMTEILGALQDIKKQMDNQGKEIRALQSGKVSAKCTLDDASDSHISPLSATAIKEMSSSMTLTHPMVHYRYDAWPILAKGGSTDRQILLRTLKEAFQCNQSRLNHQRDVLMELLDYALQKDYQSLIKLIGDRSHFLSFLDDHTLQESTHYWHQLRQDERPQRFRAAETSTMLMGQRISQHATHLTKQLGVTEDLVEDYQGGDNGRGAHKKKRFRKKPHGKKGK